MHPGDAARAERDASGNAIRLTGITKSYSGHTAVKDLSLDVPRGSVFGLLGPNGAGKTTTLRMVMDILAPDSGGIEVLGRPADRAARDRIGYMPEERGLYPRMVLQEQLLFLAEIKGATRREAAVRLQSWLSRLGLSEWASRRVNELSKGMQQKAQLVATLLHDPDILILDEPMSGLDPVAAGTVRELLLELNRQGKTIVLSSHQMETVERLCGWIALINRGEKVIDGSVAEVKRNHGRNNLVMAFEGDGAFLAALPGVGKLTDFGRYVEIQLADGADAQQILSASAPRLRISRFEIVEPSLHDIFVDCVQAHAARGEPEGGRAA
jgi:ABC-2 type transport system ATP-binding protein